MADLVTDVLNMPDVARIGFTFGTIAVGTVGFAAVKAGLLGNQIKVEVEKKRGKGHAVYRYTADTFFFGFDSAGGNADLQALVVHEAVHAGFDVAATAMLVKESEALAYIAQCLFFYYVNEAALSGGTSVPAFRDPILKAAWPVSQTALKQPALTVTDLEPVFAAISVHPTYKDRYGQNVPYDGLKPAP